MAEGRMTFKGFSAPADRDAASATRARAFDAQTRASHASGSMRFLAAACAVILAGCATPSGEHAAHVHQPAKASADHAAHAATADPRVWVRFPDVMRAHTLTNMRDHLLALAEIQDQLARGAFDKASEIAEQRLGMSSLGLHGAHDVAKFMPPGMQAAGTAMHRSASQFALVAKDASVTGDLKGSLAALARVSQTCVACHAAYRIQ